MEHKELTQTYMNKCAELGHIIAQIRKLHADASKLNTLICDLKVTQSNMESEVDKLLLQIDEISKKTQL